MKLSPTASLDSTIIPCYNFQGICNFRDVADSVQSSSESLNIDQSAKRRIRPGRLFRSARPGDLTTIIKKVGIKTVIDLRSDDEALQESDSLWNFYYPLVTAMTETNHPSESLNDIDVSEQEQMIINGASQHPNGSVSEPEDRDDSSTSSGVSQLSSHRSAGKPHSTNKLKRYHVNLIGPRFRRGFVLKSVSFTTKTKMAYYHVRGMRQHMMDLVGNEVFNKIGLAGLYKALLHYSGLEIARVLRVFRRRENYPILVHCTHGKDRTGIIIALLLSLVGVDQRLVVADYAKTRQEMQAKYEEMISDMRHIGMPPCFADAPPDAMNVALTELRKTYGSVSYYLELNGITKDMQVDIAKNLTTDWLPIANTSTANLSSR
ncbi:hypothetical protein IWQ61_001407 [Dispira simplex]|nr:hypothetical protein IWQ61_001407 [Dispira simplex]